MLILSIRTVERPTVAPGERLKLENLGLGFYRLLAAYGYMESPSIPEIMDLAARMGLKTDPATTTYYLGRRRC